MTTRAVPAGDPPGRGPSSPSPPRPRPPRVPGIATTPTRRRPPRTTRNNPYCSKVPPPTVTPVNPYKRRPANPYRRSPANPYQRSATSGRDPHCGGGSVKRALDFSDEGDDDDGGRAPPPKTPPRTRAVAGRVRGPCRTSPTAATANVDPDGTYVLHFDGGSRGNPGVAGCGVVLSDVDGGAEIWHGRQFLGDGKTNNEAEYAALLTGLRCARSLGVKRIRVRGNSQLVVSQASGVWRCHAPHLRDMLQEVVEAKRGFESFEIAHVPRDENGRADALANAAMDGRETDPDVVKLVDAFFARGEEEEGEGGDLPLPPIVDAPIDWIDCARSVACSSALTTPSGLAAATSDDPVDEDDRDPNSSSRSLLPFLVRFELERLGLGAEDLEAGTTFGDRWNSVVDAHEATPSLLTRELIALLYEEREPSAGSAAPYDDFLKRCSGNGRFVDEGDACLFLFHAKLTEAGIELLPPERADVETRRIHRRYGSHRFLDLHCDERCTKTLAALKKRLNVHLKYGRLLLAGREYGVLHAHPPGRKVVFRLFAERGVGIRARDEITAPEVAARCIPTSLNPNLSLAQYMKRMKLSFTTTVPTVVLTPGMLEVIEDTKADGDGDGDGGGVMTDGCGLISREALNQVYAAYTRNLRDRQIALGSTNPIRHTGASCPYSSFQGRIGGVKGMFVVDGSLPGVKVQVRTSQVRASTIGHLRSRRIRNIMNAHLTRKFDKVEI